MENITREEVDELIELKLQEIEDCQDDLLVLEDDLETLYQMDVDE
jgi:hypothetical protein